MKQSFIKSLLLYVCSLYIFTAKGQTPLPVFINHIYNNVTATEHYPVIITGDENNPTEIKNSSHIDMIGKEKVVMKPGFTTKNLTTGGVYFKASIAPLTNTDFDVVIISPDPATHTDQNGILHVNKWEKYEVAFKLPKVYEDAVTEYLDHYYLQSIGQYNTPLDLDHWVNPYASDSIEVKITLTSPGQNTITKWAFYMKEGNWKVGSNYSWDYGGPITYSDQSIRKMDEVTDQSDPLFKIKDYHWHFRFAPGEADPNIPWTYTVTVTTPYLLYPAGGPNANTQVGPDRTFPSSAAQLKFICDPVLSTNHGYLRVNQNNKRYLKFDDGTPYFGIGFNYADQWRVNYPVTNATGYSIINNPTDWHYSHLYFQFDFNAAINTLDMAHDVGINYMLFAMNKNNFAAEWQHLGYYDKYKSHFTCAEDHTPPCTIPGCYGGYEYNYQWGCKLLDEIIERAHEKEIYIDLAGTWNVPLGTGQEMGWDDNAYWQTFVKDPVYNPDVTFTDTYSGNSQTVGAQPPYNMAAFFADPAPGDLQTYYWKRLYKYIMSRWGYSVNILGYMPFDEVNQTVGYNLNYLHNNPPDYSLCTNMREENYLTNTAVKTAIELWIERVITDYIKRPVSIGGLGEDNHLFSMSFTIAGASNDPAFLGNIGDFNHYYGPFTAVENGLDLANIHYYTSECHANYDRSLLLINKMPDYFDYWNSQNAWVTQMPVALGEVGSSGSDLTPPCFNPHNPPLTLQGLSSTMHYYNNYEISLHNELWSTAFMGGFMTGAQWYKPPIFRQPFSQARREFEIDAQDIPKYYPSGVAPNPGNEADMPTRTMHHQYKILSDFINQPYNALPSNSIDFTDDLTPHTYYGPWDPDASFVNSAESYYLMNSNADKAWGWIHNLDHYWGNKYIETNYTMILNPSYGETNATNNSIWNDDLQTGIEHDNCRPVIAATIKLPGFSPSTEYDVILYETYADATTHTGTWQQTGTLITTDAKGKLPVVITLGCDSTNADYGFYIVKK